MSICSCTVGAVGLYAGDTAGDFGAANPSSELGFGGGMRPSGRPYLPISLVIVTYEVVTGAISSAMASTLPK